MIVAGLLFCGISAPALCLSAAPQGLILPEKSELKISWQARVFQAPVRFRLYRIDASGPRLLDEQRADHPGIESFQFIDRHEPGGEAIRFRLCLINADGSETTLGIVDCFTGNLEAGHEAGISSGGLGVALIPAGRTENPDAGRPARAWKRQSTANSPPRPPTPPPRRPA